MPVSPGAGGSLPVRRVSGWALTTRAIIDKEEALIDWADRRLRSPGRDEPAAIDRSDVTLDAAQAETAAAVAGDKAIVLVVGPAGAGKTHALGRCQPALGGGALRDRRPVDTATEPLGRHLSQERTREVQLGLGL